MDTILLHPMKTGGRTLSKSLNEYGVEHQYFGHYTLKEILDRIGLEKFQASFSVMMGRNPYARVHSWYQYIKRSRSVEEWCVCNKYLTFNDFIQNEREQVLVYCKPQVDYCSYNKHLLANYIGVFENYISEATRCVQIISGRPVKIGPSDMKEWKQNYNQNSIDIVSDLYKDDFETLGYGFDINDLPPLGPLVAGRRCLMGSSPSG